MKEFIRIKLDSFFLSYLKKKNLVKHDGRPLWKYMLTNEDFELLRTELRNTETHRIDPRIATLYYAEYWNKYYHGGSVSKKKIFNTIGGNIRYYLNHREFYKLAKRGAQMLGIKWISKQNTLYFRTLLLQGGLPLIHISENQGKYKDFLLAVLEEQPDTIEDFIFKPHITNLLPISSQNEIIYESCFEIVKSILNDENAYDELLASNEALVQISKTLKVRNQTLQRKQRFSKPKIYWLLSFRKSEITISIRIALADTYKKDSLSNILGFESSSKEYQFYLNDDLICVFRKMINGSYKTDWYQQQSQKWDGESILPHAYVIDDGKKIDVNDFIQIVPDIKEPSLWSKYSENEWRLIKGNGTSNKEAAILFQNNWISEQEVQEINVSDENLSWLTFDGEVEINKGDESRKYLSEATSFDWTIVGQKPNWMLKANMPVVQRKPQVIVYDENDKRLPENNYKVWIKQPKPYNIWEELSTLNNIPLGYLKLKIEKAGTIAYDSFFNIGNLHVNYVHKEIDNAKLEIVNNSFSQFQLNESALLEIEEENENFVLKVDIQQSKIPRSIHGSVGNRNLKKLSFDMTSPFEGMAITSFDGRIIAEKELISLENLYGLRVLSTPGKGAVIRIKNRIKQDVIITKDIKESSQPLISFKNEISRLYFLSDAMDYRNKVALELLEGRNSKIYEISGFSHTLNIDEQWDNILSIYNSEDKLDLYAVPLDCPSDNITLIPLVRNESSYMIPSLEYTNQFIVISSYEGEKQLMPRFVNTNKDFEVKEKEERIKDYNTQLSNDTFEKESWKQLLSYFNICIENEIPFSTFDQLRAISRSSQVAARVFFFLGSYQFDQDVYIHKNIPEMEKDLGFCFHWIKKGDWEFATHEINEIYQYKFFDKFINIINAYMQEIGIPELLQYINGGSIEVDSIMNSDIRDLRASLGERVLKELPYGSPKISKEYHIPIKEHKPVKLLLRSPIAVAESISDTNEAYSIWGGDEFRETIRRNIQYSQYLNPEFYNRTILHALKLN